MVEPSMVEIRGMYSEALRQIAELRAKRDLLRSALVGIVGVDGRDELEQLEVVIRAVAAPAADKAVTIDAIHALIETLPGVGR